MIFTRLTKSAMFYVLFQTEARRETNRLICSARVLVIVYHEGGQPDMTEMLQSAVTCVSLDRNYIICINRGSIASGTA